MLEVMQQFRSAMLAAGITPPTDIIVDGKKHRFSTNSKTSDKAGEYCVYPDNIPAGYFRDWRAVDYQPWRLDLGRPLTPQETHEYTLAIEKRKQQEEVEQNAAAQKAQSIWKAAPAANVNNPYCVAKGIEPLGLRTFKDSLIVPVTLDKKINSLQFIKPNGEKIFMSNGRVRGCYFSIGNPTNVICVCEGVATGFTIHKATGHAVVVAFSCGNLCAVAQHMRCKFLDTVILICADDDASGLKAAKQTAALINGKLAIPSFGANRPDAANDFNDMANMCGLDAVKSVINSACASSNEIVINGAVSKVASLPLPAPLPAVIQFNPEMLPEAIRDFVMDVADRQQSPPDFVAVAAICALSAVLGRKVLMRPKQNDDWTITPNQWGAIIGRPSAMKSPSMKAALEPLNQLEIKYAKQYAEVKIAFESEVEFANIERAVARREAKKLLEDAKLGDARSRIAVTSIEPPPTRHRLIVNDATVEKLGELLKENPNGLILVRDELSGWLSRLAKEEFHGDRAFYLECFDGNGRYVSDRIIRGTTETPNCTLSVMGGIQPNRIAPLVRNAMSGVVDDGLVQRLQLVVWPDDTCIWKWNDRAPDPIACAKYNNAFLTLDALNLSGNDGNPPYFRFSAEAQEMFIEWSNELHVIARGEDIHPALESHLIKMQKTIPGLALLFELVDGGRENVGVTSLARALDWADYLKSHAERLYSLGINIGINGAHIILQRKCKLQAPFKARDIKIKGWANLGTMALINEALQCLIDHNYLRAQQTNITSSGGRPTVEYWWIN